MENIQFAHINIVSTNWKQLAKFYTETFGCKAIPPERNLQGEWLEQGTAVAGAHLKGVHLRLPGFGENGPTLEIFQYSETLQQLPVAANLRGYGHIAFRVSDVAQVLEKVLQNGGRALGQVATREVPGAGLLTFVYARDPEGNIIELQSWE